MSFFSGPNRFGFGARALPCFLTAIVVLTAAGVAISQDGAVKMGVPRLVTVDAQAAATTLEAVFPVLSRPLAWDSDRTGLVDWGQPRDIVDFGDGSPPQIQPLQVDATVAIPTRQRPEIRITDWTWLREPDHSVDVSDAVLIGDVRILRGVPVVSVSVRPETAGRGILAAVSFRLDHAPESQYATALTATKAGAPPAPARNALANATLYDRLHRGLATAQGFKAETSSLFEASAHWLRLEISETGVQQLTGQHTALAGMTNVSADPATFRLFQAWPEELPFDPEAEGSWQEGWDGLQEVALDMTSVLATWNAYDALRFYGVGPDAWRDRLDPEAARLDWHDHLYSGVTVYWLTWEDFGTETPFAGAPLRINAIAATPHGLSPTTSHLARRHFEQSNIEAHGRLLDGWAWSTTISLQKAIVFQALDAVEGRPAFFSMEVRSNHLRGVHSSSTVNAAEAWLNEDLAARASLIWTINQEDDSLRFHVSGWSDAIDRGANQLTLQRNTGDPAPKLILDSADILYWADLVLTAGQLDFAVWGEYAAGPDQAVDLKVSAVHAVPVVWDVSDPRRPIQLNGTPGVLSRTLGTTTSPDRDNHYQAFLRSDLITPGGREMRRPDLLRTMDRAVDFIILHAPEFTAAAERLGDHRRSRLPGVANPRVAVVDAEDIYDAFGGGVQDPLALRNFLKWMWSGSEGRLASVCFFGDTSRDYRNFRNIYSGHLPSWIKIKFPLLLNTYSNYPFATDDVMVSFETPPTSTGLDIPDLATGRLTVQTPDQADRRVAQLIAYDNAPEPGSWRNRVVMAADDLTQPSNPDAFESMHTAQAEYLVNAFVPESIDVHKVYLVDYEKPSGVNYKPQARQAARHAWSEGLTVFHYIGHGSDNTLADEQLFLTDDIYGLTNGARRGIFMAFSCDVGIYDQVTKQSMAEIFVAQDNGAAIGSIAASQVSWVSPNNLISNKFYGSLFPRRVVEADVTIGQALWEAKIQVGDAGSSFDVANSQRYLLFCDPMLSLPHPAGGIEFHPTSTDTLRGGRLEGVVLVLSDQGLTPGSSVNYDLLVQEAREDKFEERSGQRLDWWRPGAVTFRGTGVVQDDTLRVPFKVPLQLRYGDQGKIRLILNTLDGSYATGVGVPVTQAATGVSDDVIGPSITLAFEDNRYRVKPGTLLEAVIADTSGVSILGTNPLNSVLMEFDDSGVLNDVSDAFEFDSGSYTNGRLAAPIPDDLEVGKHLLALYASDVLGNVGSDTLSFQLVAGGVAEIADATVFPNPTPGPNTWLAFELSDPMTVDWTIYTVAGHRIWSTREAFSTGGPQAIAWDGRDDRGDELANGVYLYVLKGWWSGDSRHPITHTGQVVIMK